MDKEKTRDEEKQQKDTSFDLNDYTIIKEGEAEILMHSKNQVFYNKTQVNNRDMSIAVLRTFISQRKLEHESMLDRRVKTGPKVPDKSVSEMEPPADSVQYNGKSNDGYELLEEMSSDEPCSISGAPTRNLQGKDREELKPARVLEALSASGLRALRYAREVEGIGQVVALDNDKVSVEACRRNIRFNGAVACSKLESHLADARVYMLTHPKEFDVVDLDPYGSPSLFLDSAVQSVADGGILMCTATDLAVLCGGNGEVCYSKYGSYPLRGKYCHEMALRILLACIESHANRYKRYIVPVLSVQMDFYVRVFVRIYSSASAMKNTPLKLSYVYQCTGCDSFHLQPVGRTISKDNRLRYHPGFGPAVPQECSDCGKKFNMGGPIWSAPIHDQEWVAAVLADVKSMKEWYPAYDRICAVLTAISEELPDVPLFLSLHNISATLKCTSPSAVMFHSAVINAGYRISGTHMNPLGLKTDAPMHTIWDIMRCWVKNHPVKAQPSNQAGSVILAKEPVLQANFAQAVASLSKAQAKKVARFLPNPERHWGPKLRAGRQITERIVKMLVGLGR
ncbi:tRNA (guanine(26)-N(2))-dimethyltransferase 1-like isoform X3 [Nicotiana tomentosiformis]|uniref:tRNA (guanine(26)-N(2))-dimethyltransferase 1-like isoform X3 n=1 Tax=Nicotiana tomentosiformis TaxID=4098 RepID=UPI00051C0974|nr:probable tRNA (guanine(26)-N(2))-dimethyltransferase 1 isoform X3 [Nicotiana tomentosiformis]XP_009624966.1 probable tRNA (guanine(26)-N(2))-dimethyltransferase 1 isoform X3 [Nicotiana tomentosiformis]XP_033517128.1 probable tRNA (guanine(26)-N(2))-dimethyltransferase 1 isoform X3 [Nicotiana tomentosiformis]